MPTYSQAPVDSYLAFLEEITEYEAKSIEEISAQAATINDEEIALPSYLSSPDQSDHENDLSEEPSIYYVIAFRGDADIKIVATCRDVGSFFNPGGLAVV